jgi:hypothetical protein
LTWRDVQQGTIALLDDTGHTVEVVLRAVYSAGAGPAIELIEAIPGTTFAGGGALEFHHLGYWSDDLPRDVGALSDSGWDLGCTVLGPNGEPGRFATHRTPSGLGIELLDTAFDRPWLRDLYPPG